MMEWVVDSEIATRLGHKILIAGLSEAGKTAIKRIFFLKQQTEDVKNLSATLNYERMSIIIKETPITIVDLGGQKIFLKRFLSGFSPFVFSSVKIFIFLIDVANRTTRNNALQYFRGCLEKLHSFSPEAEIFVFLHKNDLVVKSPNYESIHEQLKEQFQLEASRRRISFFRTTIYRPETVINSFGRIIELTLPKIARSEFVNGREIGKVEEFHEEVMTLREPTTQPIIEEQLPPVETKIAGDPAVLERLQSLMKSATQKPTRAELDFVYLGDAADEEILVEPVLDHIEKDETAPLPWVPPVTGDKRDLNPFKEIKSSSQTVESDISVPLTQAGTKAESTVLNPRVTHLIEFYRLEVDQATDIVNSGYSSIFEMAATSGVPVRLCLDILLKYLPFIKKEQGEEKSRVLNHDVLLDLFSVYMKNELREEDIVKCLILVTERPSMSIREIIEKFNVTGIKQPEAKEIIVEGMPEGETIEPVKQSVAEIAIPIETEAMDGVITLPNTLGLGFKIDIIDDSLNAHITFFLQDYTGTKETVGSSTVSSEISSDEILYLLAYELGLGREGMGIFEDGVSSMSFAAKIIHESLQQILAENLGSTSEVIAKRTRKLEGYSTETIDFIIPTEIEVEGKYIRIPDSENVAFSVSKGKQGFIIDFVQRGYPIGYVNVAETVTIDQLQGLLKEAMQLPIESEAAAEFAGRIIYATIQEFIRTKSISIHPKITDDDGSTSTRGDESSELRHYLALLEKD
ncbi:MAG: ADP-ribosylation factor-like protein [Candidatus Heimdallarchaeota archaeon]